MSKKHLIIFIAFLSSVMLSTSYSENIYKCVDKNGKVRFSNRSCDSDEKSIVIGKEKPSRAPQEESDTEETSPNSEKKSDSPSMTIRKIADNVSEMTTALTNPEQDDSHPTTIQEITDILSKTNSLMLLALFAFPPILAILIGFFHPKDRSTKLPLKYLYSLLVYAVSIPGIFSCVLTAYSLFFLRQNLLRLNVFVYFLPIVCMIITLGIVSRNVFWDQLPGIRRLYALMIVLILTFSIALAIQRTHIFIFFGGSVGTLAIIAVVCFFLLKKSFSVLFGSDKRRI